MEHDVSSCTYPPQSAGQGHRCCIPLGSRPSLHHLRCRRNFTHSFVRQLHRYYATIRLPAPMTRGRTPTGFTTRTALAPTGAAAVGSRDLPVPDKLFPSMMRSQTAQSPSPPRQCGGPSVAFGMTSVPRRSGPVISRLNTQPARAPVNASSAPLPSPTHDSGSLWMAIPSTYVSFRHDNSPVSRRTTPNHSLKLSANGMSRWPSSAGASPHFALAVQRATPLSPA
jgi:hypothetical protein